MRMDAACAWMLSTLDGGSASTVLSRHRARGDTFDLADVLSFLPAREEGQFGSLLLRNVQSAIAAFEEETEEMEAKEADAVCEVKSCAEVVLAFVRARVGEVVIESVVECGVVLHNVLLRMPEVGGARNLVAKVGEALWAADVADRARIVPQTLLYILLRSFADEGRGAGGRAADVKRVYALREALGELDLSPESQDAETVRCLLLRCATSPLYLRVDDGRRFLAHLFDVKDMRSAVFATVVNHLAYVRKARAIEYGTVLLLAWKSASAGTVFQEMLSALAEKALFASVEPLATNLRTVLSAFHSNKRIQGVDLLLNGVYGPILYQNLMVANPFVRRNAIIILADAFPIHDPALAMQDIEASLEIQCGKMMALLEDPSPLVRQATVEGTCRVLGLLWELVPSATSKKMIDIMTATLAFDSASSAVRVSVFDGMRFLLGNHVTYPLLSVALRRLGCLVHDNVERVRLSFLELLNTLKSKRIVSARYFDIVPLQELLLRLPEETPAAATKIMQLFVSSYFPLERKGKSPEEISSSQVRACLAMIRDNEAAAHYFYSHVNLYVPPGPLCEFSMRLSALALDASAIAKSTADDGGASDVDLTQNEDGRQKRRSRLRGENDPPDSRTRSNVFSKQKRQMNKSQNAKQDLPSYDRGVLLSIVADVLVSVTPSLAKESNTELRKYVDEIYGDSALKPLLIPRGNSHSSRVAVWRIASCMAPRSVQPVVTLWREHMDAVIDWPLERGMDGRRRKGDLDMLASLIACGFGWGNVASLSAVLAGWADCAVSGHRSSHIGSKVPKRSRGTSRNKASGTNYENDNTDDGMMVFETRSSALAALQATSEVILGREALREQFLHSLEDGIGDVSGMKQTRQSRSRSRNSSHNSNLLDSTRSSTPPDALQIVSAIRRGCLGAMDVFLEGAACSENQERNSSSLQVLHGVSSSWKVALCAVSLRGAEEFVIAELGELLEWCSGETVLSAAFEVSESFGASLVSVCAAHVADAIAVGQLHTPTALVCLDSFAIVACEKLQQCTAGPALLRPVLEVLRIAFQLKEHSLHGSDLGIADTAFDQCHDVETDSAVIACKSGLSTLSSVCKLLGSIHVGEDPANRLLLKQPLLEQSLSEVLVAYTRSSSSSQDQSLAATMESVLGSCFGSPSTATESLLSVLLCKCIRALILHPPRGAQESAAIVLSSTCLQALRFLPPPAKTEAVAIFVNAVAEGIVNHYSEADNSEGDADGKSIAVAKSTDACALFDVLRVGLEETLVTVDLETHENSLAKQYVETARSTIARL